MQAKRNAPPGADSSELQRVQEFIRRLPKTELFLRLDPFAGESADVRQAFEALAAYCQREGIYYAEVIISARSLLNQGLARIDGQLDALRSGHKLHIRLLADPFPVLNAKDRPEQLMARARDPLDHLFKSERPRSLVGLAWNAGAMPAALHDDVCRPQLESIFARARKLGLNISVAAGESQGPTEIREALALSQATRLLHGTSAVLDEGLMFDFSANELPLTIAPAAALANRSYVHTYAEHPARTFYGRGVRLNVSSEQPQAFGTGLSAELLALHQHCGFSPGAIVELLENSIQASALSANNRTGLVRQLRERVTKWSERLGLTV